MRTKRFGRSKRRGLAHLYAFCKGGDDEVGGTAGPAFRAVCEGWEHSSREEKSEPIATQSLLFSFAHAY
jgi:hypothetical protein